MDGFPLRQTPKTIGGGLHVATDLEAMHPCMYDWWGAAPEREASTPRDASQDSYAAIARVADISRV